MGRPSLALLILLPPAFLLLLFASQQRGNKDEPLVFVNRPLNITSNSPILVYNKVITVFHN